MKLWVSLLLVGWSQMGFSACPSLSDTHLQWGHFLEKKTNHSQENKKFRILRLKKNTYGEALRIYFSADPDLTKFDLNLNERRMGRWDYASCFIKSSFMAPSHSFINSDHYIDIAASNLEIELLNHLLNQADRYKLVFNGLAYESSINPLTLNDLSLRYLKLADRQIESLKGGKEFILELAKGYEVIDPKFTKRVLRGLKYPSEDKINLSKIPSDFRRGYDGVIDHLLTSNDPNTQVINKLLRFNPHSLRDLTSDEQSRIIYGYLYLVSLKQMSPSDLRALLRPL